MARHVLVVMTSPLEGREDEYNDWYDNVHVHDVLAIPGFVSARRFEASSPVPDRAAASRGYAMIYELETDDPGASIEELYRRRPGMFFSDALDQSSIFTSAFTERPNSPFTPE